MLARIAPELIEQTSPLRPKFRWRARPVPDAASEVLAAVMRSVAAILDIVQDSHHRVRYPAKPGFHLDDIPHFHLSLSSEPSENAFFLSSLGIAEILLPQNGRKARKKDLFCDEFMPCLYPDPASRSDVFLLFDRFGGTLRRLGYPPRFYLKKFNRDYMFLRRALIQAGIPRRAFTVAEMSIKREGPPGWYTDTETLCHRTLGFVRHWPLMIFTEILKDEMPERYESIRESLEKGIFHKNSSRTFDPTALKKTLGEVPSIDRPYWYAVLVRGLYNGVIQKALKVPETTLVGGRPRHCDFATAPIPFIDPYFTDRVSIRLAESDQLADDPTFEALFHGKFVWERHERFGFYKHSIYLKLISALQESAGLSPLLPHEINPVTPAAARQFYRTRMADYRRRSR